MFNKLICFTNVYTTAHMREPFSKLFEYILRDKQYSVLQGCN